MTEDIDNRVQKIIADHLGVAEFDWDADLADDLGADSLDPIEAQMALEQEFDIRIPDDRVGTWRVAGDLRDTVKSLVAT